MGRFTISREARFFWGVFSFHLLVALYYKEIVGINIEADPKRNTWDWFWQTLPADLLRNDMLRSLWNLHSQPP